VNKYSLKHLKWLDFSGSPLILIPENLKENWLGFYDTKPEEGAIDTTPDFVFEGQDYFINAELDFDNPITDYDRLCQKLELALTYTFKNEEILALDAFFDTFAWDKDKYWIFNGVIPEIDLQEFGKLAWQKLCQWTVKSEIVYFMNSCATLLEQDLSRQDYQKIHINQGTYQIEIAEYEYKFITRIFRFVKTSN